MGDSSSLPAWVNLIWMSVSFVTLMGAAVWTFGFFYPYLKQMRQMQFEALKLGRESTKVLESMNQEIKPMVDKIHSNLDRAETMLSRFDKEDTFTKLESHMEAIRLRIEKDTEPIKRKQRKLAADMEEMKEEIKDRIAAEGVEDMLGGTHR